MGILTYLLWGTLGALAVATVAYTVHVIITKKVLEEKLEEQQLENGDFDLYAIVTQVQPNTVKMDTYNRDGEKVQESTINSTKGVRNVYSGQKIYA